MQAVPQEVRNRLSQYGQEHVLRWWDELDETQRQALLTQVEEVDWELLRGLYDKRDQGPGLPPLDRLRPVPVIGIDRDWNQVVPRGEEALRRGEVAILIVAGGQGSRLGFEHPKGKYPIGPITDRTLFQIHAEKVLALARRYRSDIPLAIMTSPTNHDETAAFFDEHHHFGLRKSQIHFFAQGTMPALDLVTGRVLLESKGRIFTSPNGHGGTLTALADSGLLERFERKGIRHVFYCQVDNPLVKIGDPFFLGHHLKAKAEVSSKFVPKQSPADRLGNVVQVDGRCTIIEYSDLPRRLAEELRPDGILRLRVGSPAIHLFDLGFLKKVTTGATRIPYHVARKKVPYLDESGCRVEPSQENAIKFEMFVFDALPMAERWTVVETSHREEFAPLKNADGADSPAAVRQALSNLAADWLRATGRFMPETELGDPIHPIELSPLFAMDAWDLVAKLPMEFDLSGPIWISADGVREVPGLTTK